MSATDTADPSYIITAIIIPILILMPTGPTALIIIIHMAGDLMSLKKTVLILLCLSLLLLTGFSEKVFLKNGEAIEGRILSMNEQVITLEKVDGTTIRIDRNNVRLVDYESSGNRQPAEQIPEEYPANGNQPQPAPQPPVAPIPNAPVYQPNPVGYVDTLIDPELEGRRRMVEYQEEQKNPALAAGLGTIFPGTGHFYCGKIAAGFFFLGTRVLFAGATVYGFQSVTDPNTNTKKLRDPWIGTAGAIGFTALTIIEAIDAYSSTVDYNKTLRLRLGIDTINPEVMPAFRP